VSARDDRVIVIGAGVIGLACAWRLRQRGLPVTVVDPAPGRGATWTAAGMLAPVTELGYGEEALLQLNLASAQRYPAFAAELSAATGLDVGYRTSGTVQVAWDAADLQTLTDLHALHERVGLASGLVTGRELRALEPALSTGLPGALVVPGDHQVDNRALHAALLEAVVRAGVELVAHPAAGLITAGETVTGVELATGDRVDGERVVLAAGAHSRQIAGVPPELLPPVRPVKGQTLRIHLDQPVLGRIVRGLVKGSPVYMVPRGNGDLVIGASSEEVGFDTRPRTGAIYDLLRDAFALVPALSEAEWLEVSTGLRPGSPDNAPVIGASGLTGLFLATGHYRNGMLLAPVTADAIAAVVCGEPMERAVAEFGPDRFTPTGAAR
jgi:glycine oxidase